MDGGLWSRLPEDLIERVLARVPAAVKDGVQEMEQTHENQVLSRGVLSGDIPWTRRRILFDVNRVCMIFTT